MFSYFVEPPPEDHKPKEQSSKEPKEPKQAPSKTEKKTPKSEGRRSSTTTKPKESKSQNKQKNDQKKDNLISLMIEKAKAQMAARQNAEKNKTLTPAGSKPSEKSTVDENLNQEKPQTVSNGFVELKPMCVPDTNGFVKSKDSSVVNGEGSKTTHESSGKSSLKDRSKDSSRSYSSSKSSSHHHKSSSSHHHTSKHREGSSSSSKHRSSSSSSSSHKHSSTKQREGSSSSSDKNHKSSSSSHHHKSSSSSSKHHSSSSSSGNKSKSTSSSSSRQSKPITNVSKDGAIKSGIEDSESTAKKRKLDSIDSNDEHHKKPMQSSGDGKVSTPVKKVKISEHISVTPNKHCPVPKKLRLDIPDENKYLFPKRNNSGNGMEIDYRLRNHGYNMKGLKYGHLIHKETHPNGGATVIHSYQDELNHLSEQEMDEFVSEFFKVTFSENKDGLANHVMSIVHGAATTMPDLLEYFAIEHPSLTVQTQLLGKIEIETTSMEKYRESVHKSYDAGTFRYGPLMAVSLVGTKQEEVGDFFPEFLDVLEKDKFLKASSPWGHLSSVSGMPRDCSNDGPILWARPGEQVVPTADMPKSPFKGRKR